MSKKIQQGIVQVAGNRALGVVAGFDPLAVINECVGYLKTKEVETTKRAQIAAKRDVLIQAIDSEKEVILVYFGQRFAERKLALENLFQLLANGISSKEAKSIDTALAGILGILQDNPLRDFAEFRKNMERPDFIIEL